MSLPGVEHGVEHVPVRFGGVVAAPDGIAALARGISGEVVR